MNIAIITANIGEIDEIKPWPGQYKLEDVRMEYFCITKEQLLTYDASAQFYDDRLLSRYPKFMAHKLLPGYDTYIWLDARVEVIDRDFTGFMINQLEEVKIALHPDRETIGQEIEHILPRLLNREPYLSCRMKIEDIEKQKEIINKDVDLQLYCLRVFSRINSEKVNSFFEKVWEHCLNYGSYDQLMWAWEAKNFDIKIQNYIETGNPYYKFDKHKILK